MSTAKPQQQQQPSLHSTTSSTTLTAPTTNQTATNQTTTPPTREPRQYVYVDKRVAPNPDAQPKPKSRLSRFLSKFESSVVRQANAAREREALEAERTGVRKYAATGAPGNSTQSTAAFM
ncbi:uncharacterized protein B0H64DRAFT_379369 [Chaetomium fimeti]|uniref:Uncharacterized protein n=1 Tax=Chaetomium fimeti TaxID=1854472 RepID=A0AAE0HNS5_9PEZI|nr:hypothetical protein B0H64DRAFT_379369 [Chaetomium fimeti]